VGIILIGASSRPLSPPRAGVGEREWTWAAVENHKAASVGGGRRQTSVLLVEDEILVSHFLQHVLKIEDFAVSGVATGLEAVRTLSGAAHLDLLILDLGLPDMDGFDVLRLARATRPELKILVVSGNLPQQTLTRAVELGASEVLEKPIDLQRFTHTLRNLLQIPSSQPGENPT
jgi:DNA-binding response OmpR family regulator